MKICSKEMAAIVFGAGAPSGFTSSFASPAQQPSITLNPDGRMSATLSGVAVTVNNAGDHISMDFSAGTTVVSAYSGFTASGQLAVQASVNGVVQQTSTFGTANIENGQFTQAPVSTLPGGERLSHSAPTGGFNSDGGSSSGATAARNGMGFGGTGSGVGGDGGGGGGD